MSKEMTPWFPPHIKPVRAGVYEVKYVFAKITGKMYATWNGKKWSCFSDYKDDGWHKMFKGAQQNKRWRGFIEEQK